MNMAPNLMGASAAAAGPADHIITATNETITVIRLFMIVLLLCLGVLTMTRRARSLLQPTEIDRDLAIVDKKTDATTVTEHTEFISLFLSVRDTTSPVSQIERKIGYALRNHF
jgi:hypothetical protein